MLGAGLEVTSADLGSVEEVDLLVHDELLDTIPVSATKRTRERVW